MSATYSSGRPPRLQGFPRLTADADITPARDSDNLRRLAGALRDLDARVYVESVPEVCPYAFDAESLTGADLWNLVTSAGRLDVIFEPSGTEGYPDLAKTAVTFEIDRLAMHATSLADILRSKPASNRPQDRQDAAILRAMLRKK